MNPETRRKWLRRLGITAGVLIVLYTVFGFFGVPLLIRHVGIAQANKRLTGSFEVGQIRTNPFTFQLVLREFSAATPDGEPVFGFGEMRADLEFWSLFARERKVRELVLVEPFANVVVDTDGRLGLLSALQLSGPPAPEAPEEPAAAAGFEIPAVHIGLLAIERADILARYEALREPFERRITDLSLTMKDLRSDPEVSNPYDFTVVTESDERIRVTGDLQLDPLSSRGAIEILGLDLTEYAKFGTETLGFELVSGRLDSSIRYHFEPVRDPMGLGFSEGRVALRDFNVQARGEEAPFKEIDLLEVEGVEVDLVAATVKVGRVGVHGGRHVYERYADGSLSILTFLLPPEGANTTDPVVIKAGEAVTGALPVGGKEIRLGVLAGQMDIGLALEAAWRRINELLTSAWEVELGELAVSGQQIIWRDALPERPVELGVSGLELRLTDFHNRENAEVPFTFAAVVNSEGTVALSGTAFYKPNRLEMDYAVEGLPLAAADGYVGEFAAVEIAGGSVDVSGGVAAVLRDDLTFRAEVTADLAVDGFKSRYAGLDRDLFGFERFSVAGASASWAAALSARTGPVLLDAPVLDLTRKEDGTLNILDLLAAPDASAAAPEPQEAAEDGPEPVDPEAMLNELFAGLPDVYVESFTVRDGRVRLEDRMAEPDARIDTAFSVRVAPIDLGGDAFTDLEMALELANAGQGSIRVTGRTRPRDPFASTRLDIATERLTLPVFKTDSVVLLGSPVVSGRLDSEIRYTIEDWKLEGDNRVEIERLRFGDRVPDSDAPNLPFGLAIALLEDRRGIMKLDIPVPESDLTDPKFSLTRVIQRAIGVVLTKVASAPFSLLGSAFGGEGVEIPEELRFKPGSADFADDYGRALKALAEALFDRPALQLTLRPGYAAAADAPVLREQAFAGRLEAERLADETDPEVIERLYFDAFPEAVSAGEASAGSAPAAEPEPAPRLVIEERTRIVSQQRGRRKVRVVETYEVAVLLPPEPAAAESPPDTAPEPEPEPEPEPKPVAEPVPVEAVEAATAGPSTEEMRAALVTGTEVAEADLEALANRRAQAARDAILTAAEVEPGRLVIDASEYATDASRVRLELGVSGAPLLDERTP